MKVLSVRLPVELVRDAKVHAAQSGDTVQEIVRRALEGYLKAASRKAVKP